MPVTSDTPKDIYVRDIGENELEAFIKIKNQFGFTSNNKTIQSLFIRFIALQEENKSLKSDRNNLIEKNRKLESTVEHVRQFAKIINGFQDD